MKKYILIPARLESARLPRKALKKILNLPMIIHVSLRAKLCKNVDNIVVCTDSPEICWECEKYNIEVCMTKSEHKNGTERISETVNIMNIGNDDIIVDLQGDEVFVKPKDIEKVFLETEKSKFDCIVPYQKLYEMNNPNRVKIIETDRQILSMTRADAPFYFGKQKQYLKKHLSIIGFKGSLLKKFRELKIKNLEKIEKIELLRLLENDIKIGTFQMKGTTLAVDTVDDYHKSIRMMNDDLIYKKFIKNIKIN
ncbi:3-deoxy-manno-octulosonate cytidylyltransferase [Pelagibacterales bacterium SAG-MED06]|nr:3-deoxy-manno-octulosonate cytidylyltransferase [Pelagibacterales bacterium SAG-MED06]